MESAMLEAALAYAHMGLSVIPLNGKIPMFQNWPDIATTDESTIGKWFRQRPDANLGIATGKKSGVFVVDIDPRHGGDKSWQMEVESHAGKIETWEDLTGGGGRHIWFRYPNFSVKNHVSLFPGVDIRGDGGQVVAPPSIHPETKIPYEWDGFTPIQEQKISDAPLWLLEMLAPKPGTEKQRLNVPQVIPHGVQYNTLLSLAGMMRRLGLSSEAMLPTLMWVHDNQCEKPGPKQNIETLAKSVMRYAPGDKEIYHIATNLWRLNAKAEARKAAAEIAIPKIDAYALMRQPPKDVRMIIEDCLHVGCTILAGPPKVGKSYLVLGMAVGIATGGRFLGSREIVRPGRVGYWALEESETRTAKRLRQLVKDPDIMLQNLDFMYHLKPASAGGLDEIRSYCEENSPDAIVIDTLTAFVSGDRAPRKDVFRSDYSEIKKISDIAAAYNTAAIVVHHTNKGPSDGIQSVAGSHGVTAAADCIWTMQRQPQRRAALAMTGREVEDQAFLMQLDLQNYIGWYAVEEGDGVSTSEERQCILEVLGESGTRTIQQLARDIGKQVMQTRYLLRTMEQAHLVVRESSGTYRLPSVALDNWIEKEDEE